MRIFCHSPECSPGWETLSARPILQMVLGTDAELARLDREARVVLLGETDNAEMQMGLSRFGLQP